MDVPKLHYDHTMRNVEGTARAIDFVMSVVNASRVDPAHANIGAAFETAGVSPNTAVMLEAMVRYQICGQQTFVLGPGMRTAFQNTALDGIAYDDLRLPYEAFYIHLADCDWKIWGGDNTKWHHVSGIYVNRTSDRIAFAIWAPENERSTYSGDDAHAWIRMQPAPGTPLEEVLQATLCAPERSDLSLAPEPDVQQSAYVNAVRVAINLCMYLTCEDAQTTMQTAAQRRAPIEAEIRRKKSPGKVKVLERHLAQMSKTSITRVGGKYEAQLAHALGGTTRQHIVRGHFHTYLTGVGRTQRVRRFVFPFVRGTKDPAYESRRYVMAEPRADKKSTEATVRFKDEDEIRGTTVGPCWVTDADGSEKRLTRSGLVSGDGPVTWVTKRTAMAYAKKIGAMFVEV